jgi:protein arginine kinase activator
MPGAGTDSRKAGLSPARIAEDLFMDAQCSICGEEAQRMYTEIVGGRKKSMPLCLDCAKKQDFTAPPSAMPGPKPAVHFKLQAKLINQGLPTSTLRCPDCGIGLVDLRKTGRVGCARCYQVFRKQIVPLLKRVHGAVEHEGSRPAGAPPRLELNQLREELRRAIEAEDFEQAAVIRDRIGTRGGKFEEATGEDHE